VSNATRFSASLLAHDSDLNYGPLTCPALFAVVPLLVYMSSFISTAFMKKLNRSLGRKRVFTLGY
jgi:hypothetical protein